MYYNDYYGMGGRNQRIGFLGPFLLGGLVGGAAVGVSRPRPVFVNPGPPPFYGPRPPYYYY